MKAAWPQPRVRTAARYEPLWFRNDIQFSFSQLRIRFHYVSILILRWRSILIWFTSKFLQPEKSQFSSTRIKCSNRKLSNYNSLLCIGQNAHSTQWSMYLFGNTSSTRLEIGFLSNNFSKQLWIHRTKIALVLECHMPDYSRMYSKSFYI